ncbi:MAG: Spy/CpxP family protein refolding chaperone [Snowella sp.]|nr:Spy/CpxP family protein refolding chaperone [Snowella sp.]
MFNRSTALLTVLFAISFGSRMVSATPLVSPSASVQSPQSALFAQNRLIRKDGGPDQLMKQLNLTSQQQQQLTAIRQKYQGQMEQLREQLRKNQAELRTMMDGTTPANTITAKHDQIIGLRQQLDKLRFQSMLESREVLNPDQRKQFAQIMNQRRAKIRSRMGDRLPPDLDTQP